MMVHMQITDWERTRRGRERTIMKSANNSKQHQNPLKEKNQVDTMENEKGPEKGDVDIEKSTPFLISLTLMAVELRMFRIGCPRY